MMKTYKEKLEMPTHLLEAYKQLEENTGHNYLLDNTLVLVQVGSKLYGVEQDKSDVDYLGVFLEDEESLYGMNRVGRAELIGFETGDLKVDLKLVSLLEFTKQFQKGDYNVYQLLFSTDKNKVYTTELADKMLEEYKELVNVFATTRYHGMATSELRQYNKVMEQLGETLETKTTDKKQMKRRYMVVNSLQQAVELLTTGKVVLYREERAKELQYVRSVECTNKEFLERVEYLQEEFKKATEETKLKAGVNNKELTPLLVKYTKAFKN